jgi:nucleotide-binding universal stress UspA family protein
MENKNEKSALKILLALDNSPHSKLVLEKVASRPYPPDTEIHIVTAYQTTPFLSAIEPMGVSHEYYDESNRNRQKEAEHTVDKAAALLHKKNPSLIISKAVINGMAKNAILEEADTFEADSIIVGSHGHWLVERFLIGSVSLAVTLHAKCSVEIIRV